MLKRILLITLCLNVLLVPAAAQTFSHDGSVYQIFDQSMSWTEARDFCAAQGGQLAVITTAEEMSFLAGQLTDAARGCYWIGLYSQDGQWIWADGAAADWFNWAPNEPNSFESHAESYVHLFGQRYTGGKGIKEIGQWNDCDNTGAPYADPFYALENFGFICEWPAASIVLVEGAVSFGGHYYALFDNASTWDQARDYCTSLGGHLATITSPEEDAFLYSYLTSRGRLNAFFGFTDEVKEGAWQWVTGEEAAYSNWAKSEPNNQGYGEPHAMYYHKYKDGTWNDDRFGIAVASSDSKAYFLCEWDEYPALPHVVLVPRD